MEAAFLEKCNAALALVPVDLNDGANTGIRISLANAKRVVFIVAMGDSTAAVTNFTFNQHDAASSGNSKALSHANPYYYKVGGGGGANAAAFTKVVPGAAASNFVPTAFAGDPGIIVFEVLDEDLDVENNYTHVSLSAADATAAKLGAIIALVDGVMWKPAHEQEV